MLDGDERLMMQIIHAEETHMTEWLDAQRGILEAQMKEIDSLRASSKLLLHDTNDLRFLQVATYVMTVCYCDSMKGLYQFSKIVFLDCNTYNCTLLFIFNSKSQHRIFGQYLVPLFFFLFFNLIGFFYYDLCLLMVFVFYHSDPLDLVPIQMVDRDLCDPEKLRTVEKLVDDLSVALSQHFPRMWSC